MTMSRDFFRIRSRLLTETPLLSPGALTAMMLAVQEQAADLPIEKKIKEMLTPQMSIEDGIATIPLEGIMMQRPSAMELLMFGAQDTRSIAYMARQAADDPEIKGVVIEVDSGGGMLTGTPEAADAIAALSKKKPTVTFTDSLMASAAYWVGSQSRRVVASRSAQVGSIGVFISFTDFSRLLESVGISVDVIKNKEETDKATAAGGTALTDEQREYLQDRVNRDFKLFAKEIRKARGEIAPDAMRGQTFSGEEAKRLNLIDQLGDIATAKAIARYLARRN